MEQGISDPFVPSVDCTVLLSGPFVYFGMEEIDHNTLSLHSYVKFYLCSRLLALLSLVAWMLDTAGD